MYVEIRAVRIPDAAAAHIRLVGQNQRCGDRIDRKCGGFVMVADGGDDSRDIFRIRAHLVKNPERHDRAALRVIDSVDNIADIMQVSRHARKLCLTFAVSEHPKDAAGAVRYLDDVGEAVFRIAKRDERFVRFQNVGSDRFIIPQILISNFHIFVILICCKICCNIYSGSSFIPYFLRLFKIARRCETGCKHRFSVLE